MGECRYPELGGGGGGGYGAVGSMGASGSISPLYQSVDMEENYREQITIMQQRYAAMMDQLMEQQLYTHQHSMMAYTGYERPTQLAEPKHLDELSTRTKERILKIVKAEFLDYRIEIKITNMTTGLKWLLIFLGLSIFLNFDKILTVVTLLIKR